MYFFIFASCEPLKCLFAIMDSKLKDYPSHISSDECLFYSSCNEYRNYQSSQSPDWKLVMTT